MVTLEELNERKERGRGRRRGISTYERNLAVFCHLGALLGIFTIIGGILVPLLIYILKGKESKFLELHSVESFNFQLSMLIYALILYITIIGWLFLIPLAIIYLILVVSASVKAGDGKIYHYPLSIRFLRASS